MSSAPTCPRTAWIIGISGQDGSYLAELLLDKGYQVYGTIRRASTFNTPRIDHLRSNPRLHLVYGDLSDAGNLLHTLLEIRRQCPEGLSATQPLEIYNLGAQSHVKVSFEIPEYTGNIDALGTLRLLEAIRSAAMEHCTRFYQASTSELYGKVLETPQKETTPFYPRSPYGVAKLYSYWLVRNYREAYGLYACNGILFNHESPRRGPTFVTRKITIGLGRILRGEAHEIVLGNLDASRDWGHARDYCYAMWLMMQQQQPDDYVVATGIGHTVREFVEAAWQTAGRKIAWRGQGPEEVGYDPDSGQVYVRVSPRYYRPAEVDKLLGDASKALQVLGWEPQCDFASLVQEMVQTDTEGEAKK